MFCSQCGEEVASDARFCANCGTPVDRAEAADTTASFDPGALDPTAPLEDAPPVDAGTGILVVVRGPLAGARFFLDKDITTVGRHPDSDVYLDDVTVSRHHAEIRREGGQFTLVDLGSLNGTYIGGERRESAILVPGVELQVGRFKLMYAGAPT
ncbi:MAG: FHA domain-containing protein [Nitriliruptorales bacterium]|nr:FHA domain-containing protein [Nitriliruptorales bacterium]